MMTDEQKNEIYEQVMTGQLKQDIVVLENVHTVPVMDAEYHSQYFYIGLCKKGYTLGHYDYRDTEFCAGDICWILPDHVLSHNYVSDDYSVLSVFISKPFFTQLKQQGMLGKYQYMMSISCLALTPEAFEIMYTGFQLVGMLAAHQVSGSKEQLGALLHILTTFADDYIKLKVPEALKNYKTHDQLFGQFHDAITEHYRESREVAFYARLFCLSPKYFATVIKETTGIAASEWINRYVIVEAKWQLLHERQKSIQQISQEMGFSEQGSFSRLFKHLEGITPTAYRAKV